MSALILNYYFSLQNFIHTYMYMVHVYIDIYARTLEAFPTILSCCQTFICL